MPQIKPIPCVYRHGPSNVITPYVDEWRSDQGINDFAVYNLLKKDLRRVLEFIEPAPSNLSTFSHRTYELLLRACTEIEALCKRVFDKNNVPLEGKGNIIRYSDLSSLMQLQKYEILCYEFNLSSFFPFRSFTHQTRSKRSPCWYRAYNAVKHNRSSNFQKASLENTIHAIGAVYTLLLAQYGLGFEHVMRLSPTGDMLDYPDMFRARELPVWSASEQYSYNWDKLKEDDNPYQFHKIPVIL